jgi:large subunit ribosomal protein L2
MPIKNFRPLTPSGRFTSLNKVTDIVSKKRPERSLTEHKHKTGGRNNNGRYTSRHRGGGHKQLYRIIDFKRDIIDMPAKVQAIE